MATLRLFASAREVAGTKTVEVVATTVGDVLASARERFGPDFAAIVDTATIWVNGEKAEAGDPVGDGDEVAVLPPVSGGD